MRGKLIVFEGIDGVGKTTCIRLLKEELAFRGISAVIYEEQESRTGGFNRLKPFIKQKASIDVSLLFYLASAIYKSEKIEKLLRKSWVLCDRYIYSTLAYHRVRGANMSFVQNLKKFEIRLPDFCFSLRVTEKIRLERARTRKDAILADRISKRRGSLPAKMEHALGRFRLTVIDNSSSDVCGTVKKIMTIIFPHTRKP